MNFLRNTIDALNLNGQQKTEDLSDAARARARSALEAYAKATPDAVKELVGHAKGRLPRPKTLLARLRDGAADALAADHLYPALTTLLP